MRPSAAFSAPRTRLLLLLALLVPLVTGQLPPVITRKLRKQRLEVRRADGQIEYKTVTKSLPLQAPLEPVSEGPYRHNQDPMDCAGTDNGFSKMTFGKHTPYSRLAQLYVNCTVITGNLEITHIDEAQIRAFDYKLNEQNASVPFRKPFWFLDHLEEVTGHLTIFYVNTPVVRLQNLKIVRGRNTMRGSGIYISTTTIKYLKMPNFRSVLNGNITIMAKGDNLCYMTQKVSLSELLGNGRMHMDVRNASACYDSPTFRCAEECNDHCYGPEAIDCQQIYRVNCPGGCDSCFTDEEGRQQCCDSECAAGCRGRTARDCIACKNYQQDGECVRECNGLEVYDKIKSRLVTRPKDQIRYYYESYCLPDCPEKMLIEGKYCVMNCKADHYRDIEVDRRQCIKCNGPCPKVCTIDPGTYITHETLQDLVNCTEIDGSVEILNHAFTEDVPIDTAQLERLSTVQVITGHLTVDGGNLYHANKPKSLSFLRNLRVIEGRQKNGPFTLSIQGMPTLVELGLRSLERISDGRAAITNNSNLCFGDTINWVELQSDRRSPKPYLKHNMPKDECEKRNLVCDNTCQPTRGCWGKGAGQCVECRHFKLDDRCINTCEEKNGFFRVEAKQCQRCHPECATCYGPGADECRECRNFKLEQVDSAKIECLGECPNGTFAMGKECFPCHENCYDHGCNGPGNLLESGCKQCRFGVVQGEGKIQCLAGNNVQSACLGWEGYYPDVQSRYGITDGECRHCRQECRTCTNWNNCTSCHHFEVLPNSDGDDILGCVAQCGIGTYETRLLENGQVGQCRKCHPLCNSDAGCDGSGANECHRCKHFGIQHLTDVECVHECPPTHPFEHDSFCHEHDVATEIRRKRMMWIGIALTIFAAVLLVIFYLVFRCTRYRKKFEQEQRMHMPEIPDYDQSGITRRPNMNRLTIITREQLVTSAKILGKGAFGTVYAGKYKVTAQDKHFTIPVAVKAIKMEAGSAWSNESDIIEEAKIMASIQHEHLLPLVGIGFFDGVKLVTVLRPLGCLLSFLQKYKAHLSARDQILYCYQIASAMEYLVRHKIVHCDLAARNVLMRRANHVEVTDFGLAKMLDGDGATAAGTKVPFKWVPPECLMSRGQFSEASDVWAFGVTCWEIITFGASPYKEFGISNLDDMYRFLKNGNRLPQPANCGVQLHGSLISCWSESAPSRPRFSDLKETFIRYHKIPTEYIQDQHVTQRMDSYTGSAEQERAQIQRLLSLTDSAMDEVATDEQIYTDENGLEFIFNPFAAPDSPRTPGPAPIKKRHSSSVSSRYKAEPFRSHQSCNTMDTRLTEVDTDEENYLVPNSANGDPGVRLDPNGCQYTKVRVPFTGNGLSEHQYQNDEAIAAAATGNVDLELGAGACEYLNMDETTTEEDEVPFPEAEELQASRLPEKSRLDNTTCTASHPRTPTDNAYINQESVL